MTVGFPAYAMAALLWLSLIAFAILGGADFGAGIWDLVTRSHASDEDKELRIAIVRALGPIWEANGIWIVYFITGLWTVFPLVFATVTTVLFIPLVIGLLGIVMRGASFAYYTHFRGAIETGQNIWRSVFGFASAISPFALGAGLAAVASGRIRVRNGQPIADFWTPWTTPFALTCGAFAVALCMVLAAVYLAVEVHSLGDERLVETFRRRGLISGAVTSVIGLIALVLARYYAPGLFNGLAGRALPILLGAMAVGLLTAIALFQRHYTIARVSVAGMVTLILTAWAIAQMPYLIPPDVTIDNAAAPPSTQIGALIVSIVGLPIILVSLWYLFHVFKGPHRIPPVTASQFADKLPDPPESQATDDDTANQDEQRRRMSVEEQQGGKDRPRAATSKGVAAIKNTRVGRTSVLTIVEAVLALLLPVFAAMVQRIWDRRRLQSAHDRLVVPALDVHGEQRDEIADSKRIPMGTA